MKVGIFLLRLSKFFTLNLLHRMEFQLLFSSCLEYQLHTICWRLVCSLNNFLTLLCALKVLLIPQRQTIREFFCFQQLHLPEKTSPSNSLSNQTTTLTLTEKMVLSLVPNNLIKMKQQIMKVIYYKNFYQIEAKMSILPK